MSCRESVICVVSLIMGVKRLAIHHFYYFTLVFVSCNLWSTLAAEKSPKENCTVSYYAVKKGDVPGNLVLSSVEGAGQLDSVQYLPQPEGGVTVLLHGFGGSYNTSFSHQIANALLAIGRENILIADYPRCVPGTDYARAVRGTAEAGRQLADFLADVTEPLELIGFSLGAHVAGVAGHLLRTKYNQTLDRIVGLDPAYPVIGELDDELKLDSSDAEFVMAVHTAGGAVGGLEPWGDVDFYPNGGLEPQPHCKMPRGKGQAFGVNALMEIMCSHSAAYEYLADSVRGGYTARRCSGWEEYLNDDCMGEPTLSMNFLTPSNARGRYYLTTRSTPPFGEPEDYPERTTAAPSHDLEHLGAVASSSSDGGMDLDGWSLLKGLAIVAGQAAAIYLLYQLTPY